MKNRLLSLALALLMLAMLVPFTTIPALAADSPSFNVKYEKDFGEDGTVLFSEEPVQILTGDEYYRKQAYVFPVGTKAALKVNGALVPICTFWETAYSQGEREYYNSEQNEITLRSEIANDGKGIRITSTVGQKRGLLIVFVGNTPSGTASDDSSMQITTTWDEEKGVYVDLIESYAFNPDDEALGVWEVYDYVGTIDSFDPWHKNWLGSLFYLDNNFCTDGTVTVNFTDRSNICSWTKDYMIWDFFGERVIPAYEIRRIGVNTFMFVEWKNADYIYGGKIPGYYVFVKEGGLILPSPPADSIIQDPSFYEAVLEQLGKPNGYAITAADVARITELNVNGRGISDFSGIEYFTALTKFSCAGNELIILDLSKNTSLEWLNCNMTQLTALDLSRNTKLTVIMCYYNQLTTLDLSKNTSLEWLDCGSNKLTMLDVSKNIKLMELYVTNNYLPGKVAIIGLDESRTYVDFDPQKTPAPNLNTAAEWAKTGINSAVSKGFVPGDLQDSYTAVITRQEFCRMAIKFVEYKTGKTIDAVLADKGVSRNSDAFSDTDDSDILAAYALGITSGTGNGTFTPNGQFNREQAATMIRNVCKVIGMDTSNSLSSGFSDMGSVSNWAIDGVNFVKANGIMSGTSTDPSKSTFSPKGTYTRQESIVTFDRIK